MSCIFPYDTINKVKQEEIDAFCKELTELSKKHKILIGGCGCCGSPFLAYLLDENGQYKNTENGVQFS
jgi:hypothetical protein